MRCARALPALTVSPPFYDVLIALLDRVERALSEVLEELAPNEVALDSVVALFEQFDRVERLASTAKMLLARRIDESNEWARRGFPSAADYVASVSGSTVTAAKDTLATSEKLTGLPLVESAARTGRLSAQQMNAITDAAAANPRAQRPLLAKATKGSLRDLREACGRTKAAADPDPGATHARIHANRFVRTHTDAEARGTCTRAARPTPVPASRPS